MRIELKVHSEELTKRGPVTEAAGLTDPPERPKSLAGDLSRSLRTTSDCTATNGSTFAKFDFYFMEWRRQPSLVFLWFLKCPILHIINIDNNDIYV